eukprot:TRINITY_DN7684_c0_g1_i1.p1 TRINITY_DN7684_c0_g1~~TRINITY_DN7684_c0_g1_i1.p1  ORF type:complete len:404 (+),score=164.96 TRINITY_DN7684_c0_g1_i1:187-1398(+)
MSKMIKEKEDKQNYVVVTHMNATVDRLIAQETALTEIHFLGFGLTSEDVQNLSYALTENKVLRYLAMDHLNIGDQGADDLSKGLCYNSSLETVTLRWNKIKDKGAKAIANSLHYNSTLKELVMSFNEVGEEGSKAFALAMKRNNGLETLDLKWNKINDACGDLLLDSMAENRTLINLYLGGNGTTLRNVGKAQVKTKTSKSTKPRRFLSTIMSSGPQSSKVTKTVTLDQLRKDTAAKSKSEMVLQQAALAQQQAAPVVQQLPTEIQVGDWVQVKGTGQLRKGKVAYVGQTQFADGTWCGVVFDSPQGKNDGSVAGVRYFTCEANHGSFLRPEKLVLCNEDIPGEYDADAPPPVLREAAGGGGLFDDNDMMMPDEMMMMDDMGGAGPPPNIPDMDGLDDDDFFT